MEITGPDQPQDGHQCPQLGRARLHGGLRGLELALLAQHDRGPGQPHRRDQRQHRARREGQALRARRRSRGPARPPPRPPPARGATCRSTGGRSPGAFMDFGLYVHRNAEALLERGWGPYFYIPKLESHARGGAVARRVRDRRGGARPRPRHDQGDRPDRDDPGRVLHGRDPVRAARPRRRAERRALGLHLLGDQALPLAAGVRDCRTAPR